MDSRDATVQHIKRVSELLAAFAKDLIRRGDLHDASKLEDPEKSLFDEMSPKLKNSKYGSKEYYGFLEKMKPALDHHYKNNPHHPEYYKDGIDGMNLGDIVELFMDWKAASERHNTGDFKKSIQINSKRFNMSPQLIKIFENTREYMEQCQIWSKK